MLMGGVDRWMVFCIILFFVWLVIGFKLLKLGILKGSKAVKVVKGIRGGIITGLSQALSSISINQNIATSLPPFFDCDSLFFH